VLSQVPLPVLMQHSHACLLLLLVVLLLLCIGCILGLLVCQCIAIMTTVVAGDCPPKPWPASCSEGC
jgi:hypothetical protein